MVEQAAGSVPRTSGDQPAETESADPCVPRVWWRHVPCPKTEEITYNRKDDCELEGWGEA